MSAHNWARRWVRDDEIRIFRCWTTLGSASQLWARPLSSRVCGLASGVSCQLLAASASTCVTYARLPIEAPGGNPTVGGEAYSICARGRNTRVVPVARAACHSGTWRAVLRGHPTGAGGPLCWLRRDRAQGRFAPG